MVVEWLIVSDYSIRNLAKEIVFRYLREKTFNCKEKKIISLEKNYYKDLDFNQIMEYRFEASDLYPEHLGYIRKQHKG